jgi:hypothetical protein
VCTRCQQLEELLAAFVIAASDQVAALGGIAQTRADGNRAVYVAAAGQWKALRDRGERLLEAALPEPNARDPRPINLQHLIAVVE